MNDLALPIGGTFWKDGWTPVGHNLLVASSQLWLGHRRAAVFDEVLDVTRVLAPPHDVLRKAETVLEPNLLDGASALLELLKLQAESPDAVPFVDAVDTNKEYASAVLSLSLAMIAADEAALASADCPGA